MKMKTSVHETERLDNESIGKGKNKKKKSAKKKFT